MMHLLSLLGGSMFAGSFEPSGCYEPRVGQAMDMNKVNTEREKYQPENRTLPLLTIIRQEQ